MAERAEAQASRRSVFERSRRAVSWRARTFTASMIFISVVVAIAGMQAATPYMERESSGDIDSTSTTTTGAQAVSAASSRASSPVRSATSVGERGRWALDQISYPWQEMLPGWTVEFDDGRDGLFGLTLVDDQRIEIYVRNDQTDDLLVHIVAHELGHAVDVTLNDGADRRAWQSVRGIEDEPWWPSSAASDFRTGAGDFAESFAYWQAESDNFRSKLGPAPTADELELMARLALD